VGTVADGTLAHVAQVNGTWVRVVTAEGSPIDGWVDDFFPAVSSIWSASPVVPGASTDGS
jgi:hypothetical protein